MNTPKKIMIGLFKDLTSADRAYQALQELGYGENEQNLIVSDSTLDQVKTGDHPSSISNKAMKGVGSNIAVSITAAEDQDKYSLAGILNGGLVRILREWGFTDATIESLADHISKGEVLFGVHPKKEEDMDIIEGLWLEHSGTFFNKSQLNSTSNVI